MNKILNFLIGLLSFMIFVSLVLVVIFSFKGYDVTIKLNGASFVEKEKLKCQMTLLGCYAKMPNASRNSGEVLGYNYNESDVEAITKVGGKLKIKGDTDLFVISYQTHNVHIETNDVDYLEKSDVSCNAYNNNLSCKLTLPDFNKIGYVNAGYSKDKNLPVKTASEFYPFVESEIKEDIVLYPRYTDVRDDDVKMVYSNSNVYSINGSFIEFDNALSQDVIDKYKGFLEEIKSKAPYLFVGQKINILEKSTFGKLWQKNASNGSIILGICYGSSIMGYPLSRAIDVFYFTGYNDVENYRTLVHEMTHAFDIFYGYKIDGKVSNILDLNEAMKQGKNINDMLDKIYGTSRISSQSDILSLINKYKNMKNRPIDRQGYAYSKNLEFVAEAVSWYYMKYVLNEPTYADTLFPDDLKNTVEKYICIAKNNYEKTGC